MIKCQKFTFEELPVEDHWIAFPQFGRVLSSENLLWKVWPEVDLQLDPDKYYQIGIDQSTSNTGIFIKDFTNTEAYMLEVKGSRYMDASDFIYQLECFLHSMFKDKHVTHLIYERPIIAKKGRSGDAMFRSAEVLFQLEGCIKALAYRYPEFKTAKVDNIVNGSWRSVVIDKTLPKDMERKEASRISVERIWEWPRDYGPSLGKDNDVYEAIGIMMGWFFISFDPFGRPYVRGERTTKTVGALVLPGIPGEKVIDMLKEQGVKANLAIENPRYSLYQNLTSGIQAWEALCVEFTSSYSMLCLCIEANIKWQDYDCMTLILSEADCVDSTIKEIAGGEFHFVL